MKHWDEEVVLWRKCGLPYNVSEKLFFFYFKGICFSFKIFFKTFNLSK